ncbi:MAG: phosphatidylserine/phosphatidylglycerophosphate/cardiolipin synthase family protein [Deltaproteobacteria bacterium]|nr:phosphatidylserine/phosphatidylglycerophosphate/cardiolipin synthase family protein [Deltaproteobacteria bacterium]
MSLLLLVFLLPSGAHGEGSWRGIRAKARQVQVLVRQKRHNKYQEWVARLESKDSRLAIALKYAGLSATSINKDTELLAHWKQLRSITRVLRHAEHDGLSEILARFYLSKNERWKEAKEVMRIFLGQKGSALDPISPPIVKKGVDRSLARLSRGLEITKRAGVSESGTKALQEIARRKLTSYVQKTRERFPKSFPYPPGSKPWWGWLGRYAQVKSRSFDRFKPILDGPAWRKETCSFIARSRDFLHIASFHWHYDRSGYWLARQVLARKLEISPKVLQRRLKKESLTQIRDSLLVERLIAKKQQTPQSARALVKSASEAWRREQLDALAEKPIEVRVLLPSLIQGMERVTQIARDLRTPRKTLEESIITSLEKVGVEVIRHHKVVQPQFPYLHLHNLGAVVPHAKLMISRDEAMTGGLNIGDFYMQKHRKNLVWHDVAVRLRGNATHSLNWSFVRHWNVARKEEFRPGPTIQTMRRKEGGGSFYFPDLKRSNRGRAVVVGTNTLSDSDKARYTHRTALMLALASAKKNFRMVVPYLTSPVVAKQLIYTAKRFKKLGVDPSNIQIILTGYNDHFSTSTAVTAGLLYRLQEAGIKVLLWRPQGKKSAYRRNALHHAKVFTADDAVAYIGSANAMVRSLVQDWEIGVLTDEAGVVRQINRRLFDRDLEQCVPFKAPAAWKRMLGDGLNTLLGPILRVQ